MRGVDKGIAVHDTVAEELSVLQARHHMEDALLLAKGQVGLEAHQIIGGLLLVLGTQLNRRQGRRPVRGSVRPTGFMAPKRIASLPVRATSSAGWQAWNRSPPQNP